MAKNTSRTALDVTKIVHLDVKTLSEHPKNPHSGDIDHLAESIREHGVYKPIVVQKSTMFILAGNHTYRAAVAEGRETIPAVLVDCDDERALKIMIADNRIGELGETNPSKLIEVMSELTELVGTGYSEEDRDALIQLIAPPAYHPVLDPNADAKIVTAEDVEEADIEPGGVSPELVKVLCPKCGEAFFIDKTSL